MATILRTTERTWSRLISGLLAGRDLSTADTSWAMDDLVRGTATSAQVAGFLIALRAKGETADELGGLADALRSHASDVTIPGTFVDIVGTGGDGTGAANLSTLAAIVVAATGTTVVKHGGRAASSTTAGSADLIEHLGIPLDLPADRAASVAALAGITYLFAPRFNPALRHVAAVRRDLAVPTAFNVLGPLLNPARPRHQLVGVADARIQPVIAATLAARGTTALVVRGNDGLDKLTTTGPSRIWIVRDGTCTPTTLDPRDLGLALSTPGQLRGGDAATNKAILERLLTGVQDPIRHAVLLNAAAALTTTTLTNAPLADQLAHHLKTCAHAIDTGQAARTLHKWIAAAT
ncbi:anthranilate phosphoribosyltransferase [Kribbella voronezhensis]|uniref:Anthranilate phosphoribosyltransferase n=1 Tax=Kribbella voronezhensis TaxID=2512212 RepID=A0A4R7TC77_9ACTN|nr:anthranilate phosphoribosyltransferase [Kribbella voronezhensis]TDU89615.1 anthranilate phosphoribosyltransferase [Kribbella voronezhensis]